MALDQSVLSELLDAFRTGQATSDPSGRGPSPWGMGRSALFFSERVRPVWVVPVGDDQ
jgi:hypothetical protein